MCLIVKYKDLLLPSFPASPPSALPFQARLRDLATYLSFWRADVAWARATFSRSRDFRSSSLLRVRFVPQLPTCVAELGAGTFERVIKGAHCRHCRHGAFVRLFLAVATVVPQGKPLNAVTARLRTGQPRTVSGPANDSDTKVCRTREARSHEMALPHTRLVTTIRERDEFYITHHPLCATGLQQS